MKNIHRLLSCFFGNRSPKCLAVVIVLFLLRASAIGQTFEFPTYKYLDSIKLQTIVASLGKDTIEVKQSDYSSMTSATNSAGFTIKSIMALTNFKVNVQSSEVVQKAKFTYLITYWTLGVTNPAAGTWSTPTTPPDTLVVTYDRDSLKLINDWAFKIAGTGNYHKFKVVIDEVYEVTAGPTLTKLNPSDASGVPTFVWVYGEIHVQKFSKHSSLNMTTVYAAPNIDIDGTVQLSWPGLDGVKPAGYEVEWTYVVPDTSVHNAGDLKFDFRNNATRIFTNKTSFNIPVARKEGHYLVYRVRMVRPDLTNLLARNYGAWTVGDYGTLSNAPDIGPISSSTNDDLNWDLKMNFVEDGKYKQVMTYYDGLLKPRQVQTRFNSKPTQTIVAQSLYDHEGRAVINSLPIPVENVKKFDYITGFLHPSGKSEYAKLDYDAFPDPDECPPKEDPIPALDPAASSALYFSPNNPNVNNGKNAFIPDAEGYPLTRKILAAENPEKVLFEGRAGYGLQLGMDRHMEYYYGSPLQSELNRYFGQDIGKANYYRKVITTDSHDQDQFSITDDGGRIVASGLIGTPDTNALALSIRNVPLNDTFKSNLLPVPNIRMGENWQNNGSYYVEAEANYEFQYGINYRPFRPCSNIDTGLMPRVWYYYEVIDNCGNIKLQKNGVLGEIGMTDSVFISRSEIAGVHLKKGSHVWNKHSYITMDDLRASVDFFLENTHGCYKTFNDFLKEEFKKAKIPCQPEDPCGSMRLAMIKEMYPRAKYGHYAYTDSATKKYTGIAGNSIFSFGTGGHEYLYQSDCLQDSAVVGGKKIKFKNLLPQQLIDVFNDSLGAALLPLHPDYCKLLLCPVLNNPYCKELAAIEKAADAVAISRYTLSDISHYDPVLTANVLTASELSNTVTDNISIDIVAFQKTICGSEFGVIESVCNEINIAKTPADITDYPGHIQDEYYRNLIQLYTANREERLGIKLRQMGNSCTPCSSERLTDPSVDNSMGADNDTTFLVKGMDSTMKKNKMPVNSSFNNFFTSPSSINTDSLDNLTNVDNSGYCTEMADYIINTLANCNVSQATLNALRDTLTNRFCKNNHSITMLSYDSLTAIMTQVGVTSDDLCNAGLVNLRKVTGGSGELVQLGLLHYAPLYYTDLKDFLQNNHILDTIAVGSNTVNLSLSLCNAHPFEQNLAQQLGGTPDPLCVNTLPVQMIRTNMTGSNAVKLSFVNGSDTVGYFMYPAMGGQTNALHTAFGASVISGSQNYKLHSLFNLYGFDNLSQSFANRNTTLLTFTGTQSSVQKEFAYFISAFNEQSDYNLMEKDQKNYLNGVGCSEFIPMAKDVIAKAQQLNIKAGHPYFEKYFTNMLNYQNSVNFDFKNYEAAIQSCGLTDSVIIRKNIAHFRIKFPSSATTTTLGNYITALKTNHVGISDVQAYELSATGDKYMLLNIYEDSVNIKMAKQIIQAQMPGGSVLEYLPYLPKDTVAQLLSSNFSPISKSALAAAFPTAFINDQSITIYYFIPGYGTGPFTKTGKLITMQNTISGNYDYNHYVDSICRYVNKTSPMTPVFTHAESAVSAQYFHWQMTAWRNYVMGLTTTNHNELVKKSKAGNFKTLTASSWPYYFNTSAFSYNNAKDPDYLNNLYIDHSPGFNSNYNYISTVLTQLENYNNNTYGKKVLLKAAAPSSGITLPTLSNTETRTYVCGDPSQFLINHFDEHNNMYNIFIQLPAHLPAAREAYGIVSIGKGFEKDSITYINLTLATPGGGADVSDTIECIAYTNKHLGETYTIPSAFLSSHSQLETPAGRFENCETRKIAELYPIARIRYEEYKDSARNLIVAKFRQHVIDSLQENFSVIGSDIKNGLTLYYYDVAGNLIRTVSPAGVSPLSVKDDANDTINARRARNEVWAPILPAHSKITSYRYNAQNRVIEAGSPDMVGTTTAHYDLLGRVVFSQSPKQLSSNRCTYFLYDNLSRVIETGEVANAFSSQTTIYTNPGTTVNNMIKNSNRWQVTATVYDIPSYNNTAAPFNTLPAQENLKNRMACTKYFEAVASKTDAAKDMNYTTAMHYSYDASGNVKTLVHDMKDLVDPLMRFKRVDYEYDLYSGKVLLLSYNRGWADQFYQKYAYDADNRIVDVRTSSNGVYWDRDAHYDYYDHGPLARIDIGQQRVQGVDYAYTINGWLKAINGTQNGPQADMGKDGDAGLVMPKDVFSQRVDYFTGDYKAIKNASTFGELPATNKSLYNGNIAAIATALAPFDNLYSKYHYTPLQQIDRADYTEYNYNYSTSVLISPNVPDYASEYKYDGDGNLLKLRRHGADVSATMNGGTAIPHQNMDSLEYRYTSGTNRLRGPSDYSVSAAYKIDIPQYTPNPTLNQYTYDANGNLTSDAVTGTNGIDWNKAGKLKALTKIDGSKMFFTYDPMGNRLSKELVQYPSANKILKYKTIYVRDASGNMLAVYEDDKEYDLERVDLVAINDDFWETVAVDGAIPIVVTDALAGELCAEYVADASANLAKLAMTIPSLSDYAADPALLQNLVASLERPDVLSFAKSLPDITAYALRPPDGSIVASGKLSAYLQPLMLSSSSDMESLQTDLFTTLKTNDEALYNATVEAVPVSEGEKSEFPGNPAMLQAFKNMPLSEKLEISNQLAQALTTENIASLLPVSGVLLTAYSNSNTYAGFVQDIPGSDPIYDVLKQDAGSYITYRYTLSELPPDTIQAQFKNNAVLASVLSQQEIEPDPEALSAILSQNFASVVSLAVNSGQTATLLTGLKNVIAVDGAAIEGKLKPWYTTKEILKTQSIRLAEHHIYGSSRLGMQKYLPDDIKYQYGLGTSGGASVNTLTGTKPWYSLYGNDLFSYNIYNTDLKTNTMSISGMGITAHILGNRHYELTNHLGNVQSTILDRATPIISGDGHGSLTGYKADISNAWDYYPFGMFMPGRYISDTARHCVTINTTVLVPKVTKVWHDIFPAYPGSPVVPYQWGTLVPTIGKLPKSTSFAVEPLYVYHYNDAADHPDGIVASAVMGENGVEYTVDLGGEPSGVSSYMQIHPDTNVDAQEVGFNVILDPGYNAEMRIRQYTDTSGAEYYDAIGWTAIESSGAKVVSMGVDHAAIKKGGSTVLELRLTVPGGNFPAEARFQLISPWTYITTYTPETRVATICNDKENYRFGFNGQEKVNEIAGPGNHNTALFWEYDTRLGRRWNLDPVDQISISNYAINGNNPILFNDPLGNDFKDKNGNNVAAGEGITANSDGSQITNTGNGNWDQGTWNEETGGYDLHYIDNVESAGSVSSQSESVGSGGGSGQLFGGGGDLNILQAAALDIGRNDENRQKVDQINNGIKMWMGGTVAAPIVTVAAIQTAPVWIPALTSSASVELSLGSALSDFGSQMYFAKGDNVMEKFRQWNPISTISAGIFKNPFTASVPGGFFNLSLDAVNGKEDMVNSPLSLQTWKSIGLNTLGNALGDHSSGLIRGGFGELGIKLSKHGLGEFIGQQIGDVPSAGIDKATNNE